MFRTEVFLCRIKNQKHHRDGDNVGGLNRFDVPQFQRSARSVVFEIRLLGTARAADWLCARPVYGVAVCLVKNVVNVFFTTTFGVGELSNFILGCMFVVPAALIYRHKKTRLTAFVGSTVGALRWLRSVL